MRLLANINLISDTRDARAVGAQGVGLYRTEFPFIIRNTFPTEEEQIAVYRAVIAAMGALPVTFRTLDIGGDKARPTTPTTRKTTRFWVCGPMRFCLENRDVLKAQLRAILRAV